MLLVVAISIVASIGLASVLLAAYWPFTSGRIATALGETFSGKVTFKSFRSTRFPHPGCVAEGVVFSQSDSPGVPPLITVRKLTIEANYHDMLLRAGYVSRMVLEGLLIHVTPANAKAWRDSPPSQDTGSKSRLGEVVADGAILEIEIHDNEAPLKFDARALTLTSVSANAPFSYRIVLHNPLPPGEIRANGRFGPWNSRDPGQTAASGSYIFDHADLGVFHGIAGILSSQGEFQGPLSQMTTQGTISIPDFEVTHSGHTVPLKSHFRAVVNGINGDVFLERVDNTILQTRVVASGTVAAKPGQHGKTATIDFTVNHGRIQDVMRLFVRAPRPPLNGETSFKAHVILPPLEQPFLKRVRLEGDFGIASGEFTKPKTQNSVDSLSERAAGKKPEDNSDADSVVSDLAGHVELQGGTATFTNFSFSVPSASAEMHGTYNLLTERIDLHGTLKTDVKFSQTTSGFKSVLLKPFDVFFKRKPRGASIPVQLTGTYADPHPGLELTP